jgi:6-pyruvoyl tetrahydropterin synthase-like protein
MIDVQIIEEKRYKLKRFIAIQHSFDGNTQNVHAHTLEINCTIKTDTAEMIDYRKVETLIQECLDKYENKYLNDFEAFKENATIERLGEVLCYEIDDALKEIGYGMDHFEIGETPLRVYVITDELRD